jgi:hypothetical protein
MSNLEIYIQILTILFAFSGVYLVVRTFALKRKIDYTTLKARVFLNESFLMDVWTLLLIACLLFIIHAVTEVNEIFMLIVIDPIIEDILKEATELGILVCTLLLVYKWFKLVNQAKFKP